MAFIDGSVVNVALHYITLDLGGGLAEQQWFRVTMVVVAVLLVAGGLIGALGIRNPAIPVRLD